MTSFLKRIGNWFIGKSEKFEKLDAEVKAAVNTQTKRALGFVLGVVVTIAIIKLM